MNWKEAKELLNKNDPLLKMELEKLEPKYQIISQVIELRKKSKLTQKQLAEKINDKQSNIARLENGNGNFSIDKLNKIANGLNAYIEVKLISKAV